MGVCIEIWRARIGCFTHPINCKTTLQVLIVSGFSVSLCIRVTLFLLLAVHGIESNPGPCSRSDNSCGVGGRSSRGKGQGRGPDNNISEIDLFSLPSQASQASEMPQTRRTSRFVSNQPTMNSWLTNYQKERDLSPGHTFDIPSIASSIDSFSESMEPGDAHNTTVTPSEHENPTMTILIDIQKNEKNLTENLISWRNLLMI
ncbi:hypothetical protein DPMN_075580 [Dreissena polymorpha]|uniref:Uncharacterized protein n=1 Tax=Dreissena polymorpha TaxID=45954 RepID=A0A9D3YHH3_DREPO|nr:hypothetical protein DPMN_075580 [Dreissena polymorpha]